MDVLRDRPPVEISSAVYPQFCCRKDRQPTFLNWPLSEHFHPDDLVMQGFYYAGYADCIRCFYCGIGLKSWVPNDDVMKEHIRWSPDCGYLLNIKGRQFVTDIRNILQNESRAEDNTYTTDGGEGGGDDDGGSVGEVERQVREMGFPPSSVHGAVQHLQQSGTATPDVNMLIEAILELESRDGTPTITNKDNSGQTEQAQDGLQTEGAERREPERRTPEQAQQLRAENERLRGSRTCRVCGVASVGLIFLPCGHLLTCADCGARSSHCVACNRIVTATAAVYLS